MPLSFWLNHFLDSRAEIHQIFALFFFGKLKTPKSHSEINWPFHARFAKKILTPRNSFFTNSTLCTELSLFFLLFPLFFRQDNFSRLIYPMIRANLSRWMVTPASWITRFVPKIRKLLLKLPAMETNVLLKINPKTSINIFPESRKP